MPSSSGRLFLISDRISLRYCRPSANTFSEFHLTQHQCPANTVPFTDGLASFTRIVIADWLTFIIIKIETGDCQFLILNSSLTNPLVFYPVRMIWLVTLSWRPSETFSVFEEKIGFWYLKKKISVFVWVEGILRRKFTKIIAVRGSLLIGGLGISVGWRRRSLKWARAAAAAAGNRAGEPEAPTLSFLLQILCVWIWLGGLDTGHCGQQGKVVGLMMGTKPTWQPQNKDKKDINIAFTQKTFHQKLFAKTFSTKTFSRKISIKKLKMKKFSQIFPLSYQYVNEDFAQFTLS